MKLNADIKLIRTPLVISLAAVVVGALSNTAVQANPQWNYTYNGLGLVTTADGPRLDVTDVTSYSYNANGTVATLTNALGHVTTFSSYDAQKRPLLILDANGIETVLTYTARGWLQTVTIKDPGGNSALDATTSFTYDAVGQATQTTLANGSTLTFEYDDARRLTAVQNSLGARIEYTLDAAGNRTAEAVKDDAGTLTRSVSRLFDELSRVMQVISASGQTTQYSYDVNDNATQLLDGKSNSTGQAYDALDRLVTVTDPDLNDASYSYDSRDRLTQVIDPRGLITNYSYDAFDNLTQTHSPDTGTTTFTHDDAGNVISQTRADGTLINYSYDALNRLINVSYPSTPSLNVSYQYDATGSAESPNYGIGHLTSMQGGNSDHSYRYDHQGNLISYSQTINSINYSIDYRYDIAGQLAGITYPSGRTISYNRDAAGQIIQVDTAADSQSTVQTLVSSASYQPFGPANAINYGNGLTLSALYDQDYRLSALTTNGSGTVQDLDYRYDANSNITTIGDLVSASNNQDFGYDSLDRLSGAGGQYGDKTYSYDAVGNRTQTTDLDPASTSDYSYATDSNRLLSATGWSYKTNANGNITAKLATDGSNTGYHYSYNDQNRLTSVIEQLDASTQVTRANYRYNALGQRIYKQIPGGVSTSYVYDLGGRLLAEYSDDATHKDYLFLNGQPLAVADTTQVEVPAPALISQTIDNGAAGTHSTGRWKLRANRDRKSNHYGADYQWAKGRRNSYTWTPQNLKGGDYKVYAWWRKAKNQRRRVLYTITHNGQISRTPLNQKNNGGRWRLIGTYRFSGDGSESIQLNNARSRTVADAIKLVQINHSTQPPSIIKTEVYTIHNDHLGTPKRLTNNSGAVVWRADHSPFGEASVNEDVDGDGINLSLNLRFPGQYYDQESNLHYNYFRDYDPAIGRYLQSDPIGLNGGLNTYGYVGGNPVNFFDPNGLRKMGQPGVPDNDGPGKGSGRTGLVACFGVWCTTYLDGESRTALSTPALGAAVLVCEAPPPKDGCEDSKEPANPTSGGVSPTTRAGMLAGAQINQDGTVCVWVGLMGAPLPVGGSIDTGKL